ncbi:hypothetical protein C1H46_042190 [Malus baccata]|uniref:Uncharacterized protein n=1 Tax=Malus baccata TaxID=106549 RepID=A0A540KDI5_MALBA|nr:hypothetical protein C1H46_042190 [Malus baccata]
MEEPLEKRRNSSGSSGEVAMRIEAATGGGSSGNSVELEKSVDGVDGGHGVGSSTGISGGSLSKGNTLPPAEISSNIERRESNSVPVKLERSKTDSTRHQNRLSKDAAKIFDDNISVHQKLKLLNRIATVKDDGTVEFEVPADVEPQYFGDRCRTAPTGADDETLDTEDLQDIPPMQIVMLIVGTRGDVQPFIAIGKRLQDYGHRVRLATHSNFKEFVLTAGLEFYPLGGDPKVLAGYMVKNKGFLPSGPSEIPIQRSQLKDIIYSLFSACKEPDMDSGIPFKADAIIANPPAYEALVKWLEAGDKPIYIGFGSLSTALCQPVQEPQKMTQIIVEALEKTGQRGIINKGWGGLGELAEPKDFIYLLDNCPHDWLFLQCKAVVHHGGAGTTAAGLKAACPTTIVPFFGDQPFWGERVHARGVGPAPIAVDQFSLPKLVDAINFMLDPKVKERAVELAKDMENEDGVTGAVKAFFKHLPCRKPDPEPEAVPSGFLSVSRCFGCS